MADLVAVCEKDEKRAKEIGTKYGVQWHTDLNRSLRVPTCDAVTVCPRTKTILRVGPLAMGAGKNLLGEKPMPGEERSAERLVRSARKAGGKLRLGFI